MSRNGAPNRPATSHPYLTSATPSLPYIRWWKLNDLYLALCAIAFILRFVGYRSLRLKVLRRFLFLEAVILLFRGISVVLTTLSIPLDNCVSDALGNPFVESFYILIYIHHTCADLVTDTAHNPCACRHEQLCSLSACGRSKLSVADPWSGVVSAVLWSHSHIHADCAVLHSLQPW